MNGERVMKETTLQPKPDSKTLEEIYAVLAFFEDPDNIEYYHSLFSHVDFPKFNNIVNRDNSSKQFFNKGVELFQNFSNQYDELLALVKEFSGLKIAEKEVTRGSEKARHKEYAEKSVNEIEQAKLNIQNFFEKNPNFREYFHTYQIELSSHQKYVVDEFPNYIIRKEVLAFLTNYQKRINETENKSLYDLVQKIIECMEGKNTNVEFTDAEKGFLSKPSSLLFGIFALLSKDNYFPGRLPKFLLVEKNKYVNSIQYIVYYIESKRHENKSIHGDDSEYLDKVSLFRSAIKTYDESAEFSIEDIALIKDALPENILDHADMLPQKIRDVLKLSKDLGFDKKAVIKVDIESSQVKKLIEKRTGPGSSNYSDGAKEYFEFEGATIKNPLSFKKELIVELRRGGNLSLNGKSINDLVDVNNVKQSQANILAEFNKKGIKDNDIIVYSLLTLAQTKIDENKNNQINTNLTHLSFNDFLGDVKVPMRMEGDLKAGIKFEKGNVFVFSKRTGSCIGNNQNYIRGGAADAVLINEFKITKQGETTRAEAHKHCLLSALENEDEELKKLKENDFIINHSELTNPLNYPNSIVVIKDPKAIYILDKMSWRKCEMTGEAAEEALQEIGLGRLLELNGNGILSDNEKDKLCRMLLSKLGFNQQIAETVTPLAGKERSVNFSYFHTNEAHIKEVDSVKEKIERLEPITLRINFSPSAVNVAINDRISPEKDNYKKIEKLCFVEDGQGGYTVKKPISDEPGNIVLYKILRELSRGQSYHINGQSFFNLLFNYHNFENKKKDFDFYRDASDAEYEKAWENLVRIFSSLGITDVKQIVYSLLRMVQDREIIDAAKLEDTIHKQNKVNLSHISFGDIVQDPDVFVTTKQDENDVVNLEVKGSKIFLSRTYEGKLDKVGFGSGSNENYQSHNFYMFSFDTQPTLQSLAEKKQNTPALIKINGASPSYYVYFKASDGKLELKPLRNNKIDLKEMETLNFNTANEQPISPAEDGGKPALCKEIFFQMNKRPDGSDKKESADNIRTTVEHKFEITNYQALSDTHILVSPVMRNNDKELKKLKKDKIIFGSATIFSTISNSVVITLGNQNEINRFDEKGNKETIFTGDEAKRVLAELGIHDKSKPLTEDQKNKLLEKCASRIGHNQLLKKAIQLAGQDGSIEIEFDPNSPEQKKAVEAFLEDALKNPEIKELVGTQISRKVSSRQTLSPSDKLVIERTAADKNFRLEAARKILSGKSDTLTPFDKLVIERVTTPYFNFNDPNDKKKFKFDAGALKSADAATQILVMNKFSHLQNDRGQNFYNRSKPDRQNIGENRLLHAAFQVEIASGKGGPAIEKILNNALNEPGIIDTIFGSDVYHANKVARDIIRSTPLHLINKLIAQNPNHARKIAEIALDIPKEELAKKLENPQNFEVCEKFKSEILAVKKQEPGYLSQFFGTSASKIYENAQLFIAEFKIPEPKNDFTGITGALLDGKPSDTIQRENEEFKLEFSEDIEEIMKSVPQLTTTQYQQEVSSVSKTGKTLTGTDNGNGQFSSTGVISQKTL